MLSYCLKYRKSTESKSPKNVVTKNRRIMLLSKCEVCDSKKIDNAFNIAKNPKYDGYQRGLALMVYNFF